MTLIQFLRDNLDHDGDYKITDFGYVFEYNPDTNTWTRDGNEIREQLVMQYFNVAICNDCNEYMFTDADGSIYVEGYGWVCGHCSDNYNCCLSCGSYHYCDDTYWYGDDCYCGDCFHDRFAYCVDCDEAYPHDELVTIHGQYGHDYICRGCQESRDDLLYCPDCGTVHTPDMTECYNCGTSLTKNKSKKLVTYDLLQGYHPKVKITPIDNHRKIIDIDKFKGYGIELEINKDGQNLSSYDLVNKQYYDGVISKINKYLGGHAYYSRDGSLTAGFEIVTQPHTEKAMKLLDWKGLFDTLKKEGFTNNSIKAGYHIHISRKLFGKTVKKQNDNLAKLLFFFEKNKLDLLKFSRRKETQYHWCQFYSDKEYYSNDGLKKYDVSKKGVRDIVNKLNKIRGAINLQNQNTVEIRLFNSTLNYNDFINDFNFVTTLVKNVKNIGWLDVGDNSKWLKDLPENCKKQLKKLNIFGGI